MSPGSLVPDCKIISTMGKPNSCIRIGDYLTILPDELGFEVILVYQTMKV